MREGPVLIDPQQDIYFYGSHNALVKMPSDGPAVRSTTSVQQLQVKLGKIAPWGNNNKFPQEVITDLEENAPWVDSVLDWKSRALYGNGIMYGKITGYQDDGTEVFTPIHNDKEINDFMRKTNIKRSYFAPAMRDLYKFYNVFPELILSKDRKKIADINAIDASFCRYEEQDDTGLSNNLYINANWATNGNADNSKIVPTIDPFYDPAEALRQRTDDSFKYIYPIGYPTSGKSYYPVPHWNTIRTTGLLTWAKSIITYKQKMMDNQISVKYLIETTLEFWIFRYPNYEQMNADEKKVAHETERNKLDTYLIGPSNASRSIMTIMMIDPVTKQSIPGLKFTPIEDLVKDGKYISDSQEASSYMLYALSVDGTLIGDAPGKGMGAGSGSDKRVAFNNYISLNDVHRDLILEPLYVIRDYNAWDPEIQFRFRYPVIMTLDKGKQVQQESS